MGAIKAAKKDGDRQCPADLSPELHSRIDVMVRNAHRALKCHHYSLYDIRIDANEQPFILEAALFCSFSPLSVIPAMAQHAGREDLKHPQLFHSFLERAIKEKKRNSKQSQLENDVARARTPTTASSVSESSTGKKSESKESNTSCD